MGEPMFQTELSDKAESIADKYSMGKLLVFGDNRSSGISVSVLLKSMVLTLLRLVGPISILCLELLCM